MFRLANTLRSGSLHALGRNGRLYRVDIAVLEISEEGSLRTITVSEEKGIKAVVGKPKGKDTKEVQSYFFSKAKDWISEKAKAWFAKHKERAVHERVSTGNSFGSPLNSHRCELRPFTTNPFLLGN